MFAQKPSIRTMNMIARQVVARKLTWGALLATVGYQYIWRRLLVDAWAGGGYAFGKESDTSYHHGFELWHWFGSYNPNIALSFSIRLGICF